ncbi:nitroreductase family protein [Anaerosacchariphilus polymeriproducens]|uniref:Nitroreductase n=1 Tax=Anaerosacchariphilus polymeriproducens TaxID=1812858 RepID=A0A371AUT9_9FIRM|nr:nitroreductase family protein [Anaerosacchariphilus polymeriproducens]RDU23343.1 nitroreductase [Anaerosacchariphilus polymeriproducens]
MTVKECITQRRSIRKYKPDEISDEILMDLIECARLAPSACNSQPWRFKIVKDFETRQKIAQYSFHQKHVSQAPVIIICCADIKKYITQTQSSIKELHKLNILGDKFYNLIQNRADSLKDIQLENLIGEVSFNAAIAIEHIVLRAAELGLGTCWVKMADENKIRELFNWDETIRFVSLLTLGYPDEEPCPIKKLPIEELLL